MNTVDLERKAQEAAEARLAYRQAQLYEDEDPAELAEGDEGPSAPFCGCETCIVREVLDAAWPYLREIARLEARERPLSVVT